MGKRRKKKSFRQILREREAERQRKKKEKELQKMPPIGDPIYEKLEPKHLREKDRPPEAPTFFKFLVDGHNCIYELSKSYIAEWNFVEERLLKSIYKYRKAMYYYYELTTDFDIFMDNYKSKVSFEEIEEGIKVFNCSTRHGRDAADIEIVEIVRLSDDPEGLVVASTDRYCREVENFGAKLFVAFDFLEMLRTQIPPDYIGDYKFE